MLVFVACYSYFLHFPSISFAKALSIAKRGHPLINLTSNISPGALCCRARVVGHLAEVLFLA